MLAIKHSHAAVSSEKLKIQEKNTIFSQPTISKGLEKTKL